MDTGLIVGLTVLVAGGCALVFGLAGSARAPRLADPEEYLRSLEYDVEETDEFQHILAAPFLTRVMRPLGSRLLGAVAGILPGNYRDSVHLKLVHAGLAGQYRAEEVITAQVLTAAALFVVALTTATVT